MFMTQKQFRLSAVAAALMAVFGSALAEDDEIAALIEPDSSVSIGVGNWSGDRAQQGMYDGMRDGKAYGLIDAEVNKRDNDTGTWLKLKTNNLGLDNREIKGEYLRQGNVGISAEYNRITRDDPKTISTRLQGVGTTTQVENGLPAFTNLTLGTVREQTNLSFYKNLQPGLDFNLNFKNEDKKGDRLHSRGNAFQFVAEPINANTRQLEASLSYATKQFQLSGGYNGSWYDTKNGMLTVTTLPATKTYLTQGLDNQAHQLFLYGGYNFSKTTRGTFKLERAVATQNDFLATSAVPGLALAGAPDRLNGKVVTTLVQFGLSARPIKDLSLNANLRYHDVDDKTPVATYSTGGDAPDYMAYSYRTITGKLEGTYRLDQNYSLTAGLEDKRQDRSVPLLKNGTEKNVVVPLRRQLDELTSRLELRRSLSETLNGSVSYLNARRTGGENKRGKAGADGAFLLDLYNTINPLNTADRTRDKLRITFDWAPTEALSLQFTAEESRDKYESSAASPYGLNKGTGRLYSIDASYVVSEKMKLNAWYSYDQNGSKQVAYRSNGSGGNQPANKYYDLEDTGNSFGLGLRAEATSRLNLGADLELFHSVSKYQQQIAPLNGAAPVAEANFVTGVPDIRSDRLRLSMFSTYALDKQSDVRLDVIHERWKTNDWTWTFANGSSLADPGGTRYLSDPKQISNFIGARYIYKFQ